MCIDYVEYDDNDCGINRAIYWFTVTNQVIIHFYDYWFCVPFSLFFLAACINQAKVLWTLVSFHCFSFFFVVISDLFICRFFILHRYKNNWFDLIDKKFSVLSNIFFLFFWCLLALLLSWLLFLFYIFITI